MFLLNPECPPLKGNKRLVWAGRFTTWKKNLKLKAKSNVLIEKFISQPPTLAALRKERVSDLRLFESGAHTAIDETSWLRLVVLDSTIRQRLLAASSIEDEDLLSDDDDDTAGLSSLVSSYDRISTEQETTQSFLYESSDVPQGSSSSSSSSGKGSGGEDEQDEDDGAAKALPFTSLPTLSRYSTSLILPISRN